MIKKFKLLIISFLPIILSILSAPYTNMTSPFLTLLSCYLCMYIWILDWNKVSILNFYKSRNPLVITSTILFLFLFIAQILFIGNLYWFDNSIVLFPFLGGSVIFALLFIFSIIYNSLKNTNKTSYIRNELN